MRASKLLAYREVARAYPTLLKKSMLDILGYILGFCPVPKEGRLDYKWDIVMRRYFSVFYTK